MNIKAIYLPDLAFPATEGNNIFIYNKERKVFEMEIDSDFTYDVDSIIDDEKWMFFSTVLIESECKEDNETKMEYGNVIQIQPNEVLKLIRGPIKANKAQCSICKDIIESEYTHDFKFCSCGSIAVDGGKEYLRRSYKSEECLIELSEYEND